MRYLEAKPDIALELPPYGNLPATAHVFDADSIEAIDTALAAGRPLLVRGEPGTGKSQLARAAAAQLGRAFLPFTVDARTESRDLLFTVDTVARLAEAQIVGHLPGLVEEDVRARLAESRYTTPGPLWWVFDWKGAAAQAKIAGGTKPWAPRGWTPGDGAVLLIDEIDKGDAAVPNGLLEALGQGRFTAPAGEVTAKSGVEAPLVVVTTNEERALPDAFVRRCLVLQLGWPEDREALIEALLARGRAHFAAKVSAGVLRLAAAMVADDRPEVAKRGVCPPGGAEYLDLLRAIAVRWPNDNEAQRAALGRIRRFALSKHPEEPAW